MHMTVRNGKSCLRLGYDAQPGGGFQGMETNTDPQKTNLSGGGGERSSQLQQGWISEYAQLFEMIQDIPGAVELLDRLIQTDPTLHDAMHGETGPPGRPSADAGRPPDFPGAPRTGARDATYRAMATDRRPRRLLRWETDEAEIRRRMMAQDSARKQHETEAFFRRWPELKRIRSL
jgi:hypothetical protein